MEEDEEVGLPPAMLQPQQIGMVLPLTSRPISDINNTETFSALTLLVGWGGRKGIRPVHIYQQPQKCNLVYQYYQ